MTSQGKLPRGKKKKNSKPMSSTGSSSILAPPGDERFQVRLLNGVFTEDLKNDLMRLLNSLLYSTPPTSFIPSFVDSGLRYGVVWFSSDNTDSRNWLREKLGIINETAAAGFKFVIEPYTLHQNRVSFSLPWIAEEKLDEMGVLRRISIHNPALRAVHWKILRSESVTGGKRLFFCSVDDGSLSLLEKQSFRFNYSFQKIYVRVDRSNKKNQKSKKISSEKTDSKPHGGSSG